MPGGVEGARTPARLKYDGGQAGCGDEPVSLQEPPLGWRRPARELGDHRAVFDDAGEQTVVTTRIEAVYSPGEERNGGALTGERSTVCHPINTVGSTRHDRIAAIDKSSGRFHGDVLAIPGSGPGSNEGGDF